MSDAPMRPGLPTVEIARARMLERVAALPYEAVSVAEADGRWLAEAVTATRDQPPFDASAMDGWAVRSADVEAAVRLAIVGESAAGRRAEVAVGPGQAVRVFTGAPMPEGADRVVLQELAERQGDVLICGASEGPTWVRRRGCDFAEGQVLLEAGQRMTPWSLAMAASAGAGEVRCAARPRVAILATGDELVEAGEAAGPDQIYDSAGPALAAFVGRHSGVAVRLKTAGDSEGAILEAVAGAAFDLLVTVGGASVGDHDLVKPALRGAGAALHVEGVAMRPGKPVWFASLGDGRPVLGLPGNPASALVCAELFLAPVLARLQGGDGEPRLRTANLTAALPANGPRDHYMRAWAEIGLDGRLMVTPFKDQDSSLVTVMAAANALVRREPMAAVAEAGATVSVLGPSF